MTSLWEKINQKLHEIVDRALNARSLQLYDQYVRDVEAYRQQIEDSAAAMYAGIEANKRRLEKYFAEAQTLNARVDDYVLAGKQDTARWLQGDLTAQEELITTTQNQIANQDADYQRLLTGRQETQERLQLMRGERPAVESLMAMIRAGELIESIELTLGSLAQLGPESGMGQVAAGIMQKFDKAEARWQMAAAKLDVDQVSMATEQVQIDDQLDERMRRLGIDESE